MSGQDGLAMRQSPAHLAPPALPSFAKCAKSDKEKDKEKVSDKEKETKRRCQEPMTYLCQQPASLVPDTFSSFLFLLVEGRDSMNTEHGVIH